MKADEVYGKITKRKCFIIAIFVPISFLTFIGNISTGPSNLPISEVFFTLMFPSHGTLGTRVIVWTIRFPMALMGIIVGVALAIAGAEMQTILDNPLASPYTLGISSAAGFGAALALVLGVGVIPIAGAFLVPLNAFIFSMVACIVLLSVSKMKGATRETMVLAGIAVMFLFSSLLALLQYRASQEELQAIVFWLFGSLYRATWLKVGISLGILPIALLFAKWAWKLTALRLGDDAAKSLGIDVERMRVKVLVVVSILTATAVCFVGVIGFIGIVAPHIARILVGEDQRFFLPLSALTGAILLSGASICGKLIMPGAILPVGIVTSLIGVPFFLSLVLTKRREMW